MSTFHYFFLTLIKLNISFTSQFKYWAYARRGARPACMILNVRPVTWSNNDTWLSHCSAYYSQLSRRLWIEAEHGTNRWGSLRPWTLVGTFEEVGCVMCLLYSIGCDHCSVYVCVRGWWWCVCGGGCHYRCPCLELSLHENQCSSGRIASTEWRHIVQE